MRHYEELINGPPDELNPENFAQHQRFIEQAKAELQERTASHEKGLRLLERAQELGDTELAGRLQEQLGEIQKTIKEKEVLLDRLHAYRTRKLKEMPEDTKH
jgi:hypothetical protein